MEDKVTIPTEGTEAPYPTKPSSEDILMVTPVKRPAEASLGGVAKVAKKTPTLEGGTERASEVDKNSNDDLKDDKVGSDENDKGDVGGDQTDVEPYGDDRPEHGSTPQTTMSSVEAKAGGEEQRSEISTEDVLITEGSVVEILDAANRAKRSSREDTTPGATNDDNDTVTVSKSIMAKMKEGLAERNKMCFRLKAQRDAKREECLALQYDLEISKQENARLKEDAEEKKGAIRQQALTAKKNVLASERSKIDKELEEYRKEIVPKHGLTRAEHQKKMQEREDKHKDATKATKIKYEKAMDQIKAEHRKQLTSLKQKTADSEAELKQQKEDLRVEKKKIKEDADVAVKEAKADARAARPEHSATVKQKDKEIGALQAEVKELKAAARKSTLETEKLKGQIGTLDNHIESLNETISARYDDIRKLNTQLENQQNSGDGLQRVISKLQDGQEKMIESMEARFGEERQKYMVYRQQAQELAIKVDEQQRINFQLKMANEGLGKRFNQALAGKAPLVGGFR